MKTKILLISLSALLLIPNFINWDINGKSSYNKIERFDKHLNSINSIEKLDEYIDAEASVKRIRTYSEQYIALVAYIVSCRFYHGFSHYTLSENWVAALAEKTVGYGLASKVKANEILQQDNAACSQQAIVMMEILKRKNINYRNVGFPHHYALEAMIGNHWYFFDPNMEPTITLAERSHENWNGNSDKLKKYYSAKQSNANWFGSGTTASFGPINETPAGNVKIFHSFSWFLSKFLFCVPLVFVFARKRRPFMYAVKPINHFPKGAILRPMFSA